jgi:hypothetical protein
VFGSACQSLNANSRPSDLGSDTVTTIPTFRGARDASEDTRAAALAINVIWNP